MCEDEDPARNCARIRIMCVPKTMLEILNGL